MSKFQVLVGHMAKLLKSDEPDDDDLFVNVSAKRRERIRQKISQDVREHLRFELTPIIREQVESELGAKLRKKIREELVEEARNVAPTTKERRGFQTLIQEIEIDAHAQADIASRQSERVDAELHSSRRWRTPLTYLLSILALPTFYGAFHLFGLSAAFFVIGLTFLAALVTLMVTSHNKHQKLESSREDLLRVASDYLLVKEQAKAFRLVRADIVTSRHEMAKLMESIEHRKQSLDREFNPRVSELELARVAVRHRISTEDPPEVRLEEFDERLAEAESRRLGG